MPLVRVTSRTFATASKAWASSFAMLLRITHETRYDYAPPVGTAQHILHLQPRDTLRQHVVQHQLQITPEPSQSLAQTDVYGNPMSFIALQTPHDALSLVSRSVVKTLGAAAPDAAALSVTWESVRNRFRYQVGARYDPAIDHVFASPHVPRHPAFHDYALPSFTPGRPLHAAACELSARIHFDFRYESHSTDVSTPALEALQQRRGVCQDFAHIFIACCRAMGLAARYVSGYLLTSPPPGQPRLIGSDASHAWVSLRVPHRDASAGTESWYDFDPTNNREGWCSPGEDYVRLAVGRDFADVSPLRGVLQGGTNHTLQVNVTVAPI